MIKNKSCMGTSLDQVDGDRELTRKNADIKRQTVLRKNGDILNEGASPANLVRLGVEHTPNPLQFSMSRDLVQVAPKILALGPSASDHACQWIVRLPGKRKQMPRLLKHVGLVNICLKV